MGCGKPCESTGGQSLSGPQVAHGKPVECRDGSVGFETIVGLETTKERDTDDERGHAERGHAEVSRKEVGRNGWWQIDGWWRIDKVNMVTEDGWGEGASSGWRGCT